MDAKSLAPRLARDLQSPPAMNFLNFQLLGNSSAQWGLSILIASFCFFALKLAQKTLFAKLETLSKRTSTGVDDLLFALIHETKAFFILVLSIYIGMRFLDLPDRVDSISWKFLIVALLLQSMVWAVRAVNFLVGQAIQKRSLSDAASVSTLGLVSFLSKLLIGAVILLLAMHNLGINITALVAGLGVGGIAVALALQNILGDLFASLTIVLDKPFVVGDFVVVDEYAGTIQHIGLKTTRLVSLSGEQLVFSNADLLKSRIRNYKRMRERRIVFNMGVTYDTPASKLRKIPGMIKSAIESQNHTRFERAHFNAFQDSALNFEAVYWVTNADYNQYMDIQQALNLRLIEQFAMNGIEFAFPTRTLELKLGESEEVPRKALSVVGAQRSRAIPE